MVEQPRSVILPSRGEASAQVASRWSRSAEAQAFGRVILILGMAVVLSGTLLETSPVGASVNCVSSHCYGIAQMYSASFGGADTVYVVSGSAAGLVIRQVPGRGALGRDQQWTPGEYLG